MACASPVPWLRGWGSGKASFGEVKGRGRAEELGLALQLTGDLTIFPADDSQEPASLPLLPFLQGRSGNETEKKPMVETQWGCHQSLWAERGGKRKHGGWGVRWGAHGEGIWCPTAGVVSSHGAGEGALSRGQHLKVGPPNQKALPRAGLGAAPCGECWGSSCKAVEAEECGGVCVLFRGS